MLWQIALALGEERKFIRHLRIFFLNSTPVAQSLRIGHLIHMDGQSVLFCLWGKLKLVLVSIYDFDFAPRWNQNVCSSWNLLKIWVKVFLSTGYSGIYTHFLTWYIRGWLLRWGEMENILLFTSTEFGWDGIYQLIMILIFPSTFIAVISTKKIIIISDIILSIFISLLSVMEKD